MGKSIKRLSPSYSVRKEQIMNEQEERGLGILGYGKFDIHKPHP